jgi:hypothetical protein
MSVNKYKAKTDDKVVFFLSFAKPVLTEGFYIVKKEEFSITCYMSNTYI